MKCWQKVINGTVLNRRADKVRHLRLRTVESHPSTISLEIKPLQAKKNELSPTVKARLEEQVEVMITTIRRIVQWEGADIRQAMNYVRSSVIFKDIDGIDSKIVDELVGEYANSKIADLQAAIQKQRKEISQLKDQMKAEHEFNQINLRANSIFISPTGSIVHQLFLKAKDASFQQFMVMYNKLHSQNHKSYRVKSKDRISSTTTYNDGNKIKSSFQDYLTPILLSFKQEQKHHFLQLLKRQMLCNRPCCKWGLEESIMGSPAQKYLMGQPNNRSHSVYQNSNFNQYYERYCGKDFKLSNVVSITRTHNEQIEKIYSRIKNQQKQRTKHHQRYKSVA